MFCQLKRFALNAATILKFASFASLGKRLVYQTRSEAPPPPTTAGAVAVGHCLRS